jgi:hypothetical protein
MRQGEDDAGREPVLVREVAGEAIGRAKLLGRTQLIGRSYLRARAGRNRRRAGY